MPDGPVSSKAVIRRLALQGSLGLRDVKRIHQLLSDTISAAGTVELDLRETTGMDISIVQLIAAALKSVQQRGGELTLVSHPNSSFRKTLIQAGLLRAEGAVSTAEEEFWAGKLPAWEGTP